MSLEWTWCAASSRISQIPASGSGQRAATVSAKARIARQVSEFSRCPARS
jgi:hypothetical protein